MSASAAVWNGRFGAFGIVSVTLGSLLRWRKVCQKLGVKSNLRLWGGRMVGLGGSGAHKANPPAPAPRPTLDRASAVSTDPPPEPSRILAEEALQAGAVVARSVCSGGRSERTYPSGELDLRYYDR